MTASEIELPTVLLIHEAWHTPTHYARLIDLLHEAGFAVACPELLTSSTNADNYSTFADDVALIYSITFDLASEGHDILVLMHGIYGGLLGTEACGTLSRAQRTAFGHQGGVVGLVYIAASLPSAGDTWHSVTSLSGTDAEPSAYMLQQPDGTATLAAADRILFNDLGANESLHWANHLVRFCAKLVDIRVDANDIAWKHCRGTYLVCGRDQLVPEKLQRAMFDAAVKRGAVMDEEYLPHAGHEPQLSDPGRVVLAMLAAAAKARCGRVGDGGIVSSLTLPVRSVTLPI